MTYANESRAIAVADDLNANLKGYGTHRAALTAHGWEVRRVSPYSNGDVIRWSEQRA